MGKMAMNAAGAIGQPITATVAQFGASAMQGAAQAAAQAQTVIAVAALCRQATLVSLALACASYQPTSYDDALAVQTAVLALFDREITAVADAGQDRSYAALRQLRTAVAYDLTTRGSLLPHLLTVTALAPVSTLELAYRLYADASRADEIAQRANVQHPGFLPASMQLLAS